MQWIRSTAEQVASHAETASETLAILSTNGKRTTYAELRDGLDGLAAQVQQAGVPEGATVVLLLHDGPIFLTSLLAVSRAWACAPLNPALPLPEVEALLRDLQPAAVLVSSELTALLEALVKLGIAVFSASQDEKGASLWTLVAVGTRAEPRRTDAAILLYTSGTTGRNKLVGLSHGNLQASMQSTCAVLNLTSSDRVLLLSPLFHLQGILSAMSQLQAGGAVIAPRGFERGDLPRWLEELKPTWYTCGPTLHSTICSRLRTHGRQAAASLRFVRSIGAPLSAAAAREIYDTLGVPVLNGYGLTETGVLTSVPVEEAMTHPASVGRTMGAELRVVDAADEDVPPGAEGEILVRGANVTSGYRNDPEANEKAFRNGWFHTGDLGYVDIEGFFFITGRLKDQINRAGEKIHPTEVDEVLLQHPDVLEAAAFAVPHPTVGENIFCAVVLAAAAKVTAADLRHFVAGKLAGFKVPRRIVFVDRIPRGATGKPKRHMLAAEFGDTASPRATTT